jgi:hypothetical protein
VRTGASRLCVIRALGPAFAMHRTPFAMPHFEDDEDPKRPRPVEVRKKLEGVLERGESRKDNERDDHRHVHVRC